MPWLLPWIEPLPQRALVGVLLLAVVAAIAAATTSRAAGVVMAVVALALVGAFVLEVLFSTRDALIVEQRVAPPASVPERIRLLDYNVLHGYPGFKEQTARAERLHAAIEDLQPDVVVLQEAWRTWSHGDFAATLARRLGMDSAFARANGSLARIGFEEGEAVLSRFPIVRAERVALAPRRPFYERRIALHCELAIGGESRLTVVGVHLDHRLETTRAAQSAALAGWIDRQPAQIVAGDFNAPSDAVLGPWRARRFDDVLPGAIDHVLLAPDSGWRVAAAGWELRPGRVERFTGRQIEYSDHPAIVIDLEREVVAIDPEREVVAIDPEREVVGAALD